MNSVGGDRLTPEDLADIFNNFAETATNISDAIHEVYTGWEPEFTTPISTFSTDLYPTDQAEETTTEGNIDVTVDLPDDNTVVDNPSDVITEETIYEKKRQVPWHW